MSDGSPPTSSFSRRFKKRDSSAIGPSSPAPPHKHSRLPGNSTGSLDIPIHHANAGATLVPVPRHPSFSSASLPSTTNSMHAHLPPNLSPSPPLLGDDTRRSDAPGLYADIADHPPASASQCPSSSSLALPWTVNPNTSPSLPPSPPAPSRQPVLLGNNAGGLDGPANVAVTELPPAPISHPCSVSSVSAPSTTNRTPTWPNLGSQHPTLHVEDLTSQNSLSTHPTVYAPPHSRQGQAFNYQGGTHVLDGARNFVMKDTTFIENNIAADDFMEKLLQKTIIGAEFDSSDRDPPPWCHPGTRLAIIQRCLNFIAQCHNKEKLRWVVGPAGVGKSAVMQMVTETASDGVIFTSIFLSVNGRRDGKKTIITIAYQLAVKCETYHQFIRDLITRDPSLLRKSLPVQFKKFIVEPFMHQRIFDPSLRFFIVIDGLDECDDPLTQLALLELITDFCITYPTSPIVWFVASRPEPHITAFFDNPDVRPAYTKEVMVIDSDEACDDVQRFLREELKKIKFAHPTLRRKREWPLEHEFTKIASAAGGLFAYAATVIRYIGDSTRAGPAAQLRRVLENIDATAKDHVVGRDNPMAQLDALYRRILSNVPDNVMINTRKLLLVFQWPFLNSLGFRALCNVLELTEDDGYDAISPLHAVLKIPEPDRADGYLSYYHKSFGDFLSDFERSGFSHDFGSEGSQLCDHTSLRIMEELQDDSDGVAGSEDIKVWNGAMKGHCGNISLSWPGDDRFQMTDEDVRRMLYQEAMCFVVSAFYFPRDNLVSKNISCFHGLTTRFTVPTTTLLFPFSRLRGCAFDRFRDELAKLGKLKQVPLRTLDCAAVCGDVELQFTSSIEVADPWNAFCNHVKEKLDGSEQRRGWLTKFKRYYRDESGIVDLVGDTDIPQFHSVTLQQNHQEWVRKNRGSATVCSHCMQRLACHFMDNQDQLAMVFVDSTGMSYVEVSFVDPDDGVSEWRYRFLHSGAPTGIDA